jgi:hypothetical protein
MLDIGLAEEVNQSGADYRVARLQLIRPGTMICFHAKLSG